MPPRLQLAIVSRTQRAFYSCSTAPVVVIHRFPNFHLQSELAAVILESDVLPYREELLLLPETND